MNTTSVLQMSTDQISNRALEKKICVDLLVKDFELIKFDFRLKELFGGVEIFSHPDDILSSVNHLIELGLKDNYENINEQVYNTLYECGASLLFYHGDDSKTSKEEFSIIAKSYVNLVFNTYRNMSQPDLLLIEFLTRFISDHPMLKLAWSIDLIQKLKIRRCQ